MVDYTQEKQAIEEIEYDWSFINVLRDYLVDLDITEIRLGEVREELVKSCAGLETGGHKTYGQLLTEEEELQKRLVVKYNRVKRTIYAINEMDSPASRFLLDYLLTPGLTVHKLSKMYNLHREVSKRLLSNYSKLLADGRVEDLKKMIDEFELKYNGV